MKIKYLLLILLIIVSCTNQNVVLYYYNGLEISKNNTWGSSLQIFFMEDYDMIRVPIRKGELKDEISLIKTKIISKGKIIVPDDSNYTFAFISKKDTLFADDRLEFWRYKDKGISYKLNDASKNTILKQYKLNPNQQ